jgi:hypothetical protein
MSNWKNRRLVWTVIALLAAEAVVIVALPSRIPRPARVVTAAVNLIAAACLWTASRQSSPGRR